MSNDVFTATDVQALIAIAETAPIPGGAKMAVARSELYQRFVKFYEGVTAAVESPKLRKSRSKSTDQTPPADTGAGSNDAEDLTK